MTAKSVGVKIARGTLYIIGCIAAVIVVVVLVVGAYYTAMNTTNVYMLTKDAFAKRAETVLLPEVDGSDRMMLQNLFAPRVIAMDEMLNSHYYDDYEIINYYEDTNVELNIVWPWEDETTLRVTERVRDINGTRIGDSESEESVYGASSERPPAWRNGVYEVMLRKDKVTDSWRIYSLLLVEPIVLEEEPDETEEEDGEEAEASRDPELLRDIYSGSTRG